MFSSFVRLLWVNEKFACIYVIEDGNRKSDIQSPRAAALAFISLARSDYNLVNELGR